MKVLRLQKIILENNTLKMQFQSKQQINLNKQQGDTVELFLSQIKCWLS